MRSKTGPSVTEGGEGEKRRPEIPEVGSVVRGGPPPSRERESRVV